MFVRVHTSCGTLLFKPVSLFFLEQELKTLFEKNKIQNGSSEDESFLQWSITNNEEKIMTKQEMPFKQYAIKTSKLLSYPPTVTWKGNDLWKFSVIQSTTLYGEIHYSQHI